MHPLLGFFLDDTAMPLQWLLVRLTGWEGHYYWPAAYHAVVSFYNLRLSCTELAEWGNYKSAVAMWECLCSRAPEMCSLTTLRQAQHAAGSLDNNAFTYYHAHKYCNACHDDYDWWLDKSSIHDDIKFCGECVAKGATNDICEHCDIQHEYMNPRAFVDQVEWLTGLATPHFSQSLILAALSYVPSVSTLTRCGCRRSGSRCYEHNGLTTEKKFSILIKLSIRHTTGKWIPTIPPRQY